VAGDVRRVDREERLAAGVVEKDIGRASLEKRRALKVR